MPLLLFGLVWLLVYSCFFDFNNKVFSSGCFFVFFLAFFGLKVLFLGMMFIDVYIFLAS